VYDKSTTEQYKNEGNDDSYFFRYFVNIPVPEYNTCFIGSMQGFYDGLVKFTKDSSNKWSAFLPDVYMSADKA